MGRLFSVSGVNLLLCIIILVLGYQGYKKSKDKLAFYIGLAFGFFGLSHLTAVLGLSDMLTGFLISMRLVAYLVIIFTLYEAAFKK